MAETMAEKHLVARWQTPEGERLTKDVFGRLVAGQSLSDLGLGEHEGRIDLRGILAPAPVQLSAQEKKGWVLQEVGGLVKFERVKLVNLDLSGGRLDSLRLFNTTIPIAGSMRLGARIGGCGRWTLPTPASSGQICERPCWERGTKAGATSTGA
jgi:hypothetical protein